MKEDSSANVVHIFSMLLSTSSLIPALKFERFDWACYLLLWAVLLFLMAESD